MANSQAICTSFKQEALLGIHALGTTVTRGATTADGFKAALYLATASIGAATAAYSATNEVSGTNYTAGGATFTWAAPATSGTTAFTTPSANISWANVTLATSFDCVLFYNTSQSNKAVMACTFTGQTVAAATFTLTMPTNDSSTGLLRIA
jgi:hypothetical protein